MDRRESNCPICGEGAQSFGERSGYALGQCRACGHSFVREMPSSEDLARIYERYSYDTQSIEALPAFLLPVVAERVRTFRDYRRGGRLLDVGFGAGALLRAARQDGWKTYGIETSALAVEQAKKNDLGEVVLADFRKSPFERGFFDVVVMSELIEHIPDPSSFVRMACKVLAPGGLLYLTTPHGRGVSGRILKENWSVCAPPEHLHLFSRRSMVRCLKDAGFGSVRIETRNLHPHELIAWMKRRFSSARESSGDSFGIPNRVDGSYRLNAALVGSQWGRLAKGAANRVLDVTTLGDGIVVYATTPSGSRARVAAT